jgi:mRNA interferase RelE/StbE
MRLALTDRFKHAYGALQASDQSRADKALRLLATNWRHPSLHVKKIKGTDGIWEARASQSLRITFGLYDDLIVLRNIGKHDEILSTP